MKVLIKKGGLVISYLNSPSKFHPVEGCITFNDLINEELLRHCGNLGQIEL